jgi:hypothetical protein
MMSDDRIAELWRFKNLPRKLGPTNSHPVPEDKTKGPVSKVKQL